MNLGVLNLKTCSHLPLLQFVRYAKGKSILAAKTLSQRLAEERYEDPVLHRKHDIGFPFLKPSRKAELSKRLEHLKGQRKNSNLEKLARNNELHIDLDQAKEDWLSTAGPFHIRKVAEHYSVFEHLFGRYAYFTPRVSMDIKFQLSEDVFCPVYYGNRIKPVEAQKAPEINFDHTFSMSPDKKSSDSLWTIILTNPDGHLTEQNQEYVHWMIGNITKGDLSKGDLIVPYLQPIPPKGTGYHRHIFVLYKQEKKLDFDNLKVTDTMDLSKRTFNTFDFYRKHQDEITPAGLSFFQANWDDSLTSVYHHTLNMKEPIYDYDYPEGFFKDQKAFPHKEPFNLYMDRYADPKEVNKRFLEEKLAKTHPFDGPEAPLRFFNAHYFGNEPSWLKTAIRNKRLRRGRINDVEN